MEDRLARLERQVMALAEEQGELLGRVTALEEAVAEDPAPLVLLDIDGVLADFNAAYYRALTGQRLHEDDEGHDLFDRWHWPAKVASQVQAERVFGALKDDYDFWWGLRPYPEASALVRGAISRASVSDAQVVLLTSRPETPAVVDATQEWLVDILGLDTDDFTLAFAEDKAAWLRAQEGEAVWALDDKPEHVTALRAEMDWPHSAWLWHQPWNRGHCPGLAVSSVDQALAILTNALSYAAAGGFPVGVAR